MLIQNVLSFEDFNNYLKTYKFIIVNISAPWCKPCMTLKPQLEKFINVLDESEFIYLKIDMSVFEEDNDLQNFFIIKKIPYFACIKEGSILNSFVNADFGYVTQVLFNFIKENKNILEEDKEFNKDIDI